MTAGLAIYDTMQFVTCDVATYCIGVAASMGAVLLTAGTKGKRYALPNSDIMIHQVSGGAQGTASDVERTVEYMFKLKKRLISILAHHTGKTDEQIQVDSDRDYWITRAAGEGLRTCRRSGEVAQRCRSRSRCRLTADNAVARLSVYLTGRSHIFGRIIKDTEYGSRI